MNRSDRQSQELIGRAIDDGEPLPEWLVQRISKNSSLNQFQESAIELAGELRQSADGWINLNRTSRSSFADLVSRDALESNEGPVNAVSSRPHYSAVAFACTAAVILAITGMAWFVPSSFWKNDQRLLVDNQQDVGKNGAQVGSTDLPLVDETSSQDSSGVKSAQDPQDQFERYFYVTVESSFRTFQSFGEVLSNNAVSQPLQRTIRASSTSDEAPLAEITAPDLAIVEQEQYILHAKQIQLIRELMETTDFLVETLPKEVTQSWMDLSIASNDSR